jgi:hypothetical protein
MRNTNINDRVHTRVIVRLTIEDFDTDQLLFQAGGSVRESPLDYESKKAANARRVPKLAAGEDSV